MTDDQIVLGDHIFRFDGIEVQVLHGDAWVSLDDLLELSDGGGPSLADGAWLGCGLLVLAVLLGAAIQWGIYHWVAYCP